MLNDKEVALLQSLIDKATDRKSTLDDITQIIHFAQTLLRVQKDRPIYTKQKRGRAA